MNTGKQPSSAKKRANAKTNKAVTLEGKAEEKPARNTDAANVKHPHKQKARPEQSRTLQCFIFCIIAIAVLGLMARRHNMIQAQDTPFEEMLPQASLPQEDIFSEDSIEAVEESDPATEITSSDIADVSEEGTSTAPLAATEEILLPEEEDEETTPDLSYELSSELFAAQQQLTEQQDELTALQTTLNDTQAALEDVQARRAKDITLLLNYQAFNDAVQNGEPYGDSLQVLLQPDNILDDATIAHLEFFTPAAQEGFMQRDALKASFAATLQDYYTGNKTPPPANASLWARTRYSITNWASSLVRIRKVGVEHEGMDTQTILARAEHLIQQDALYDAATMLQTLPNNARQHFDAWIDAVEYHSTAMQLLPTIDNAIRSHVEAR